jgi:hypothetical protein
MHPTSPPGRSSLARACATEHLLISATDADALQERGTLDDSVYVSEISEKLHEFLEENFPSLQEDKVRRALRCVCMRANSHARGRSGAR